MSNFNRVKKDRTNSSEYEYECDMCGMNFGNSLGDMEIHKTIVHLQNGNTDTVQK